MRIKRNVTLFIVFLIVYFSYFNVSLLVVDGVSMQYTIAHGSICASVKIPYGLYRKGMVVKAIDPEGVIVVKRIKYIKDHKVFLDGDLEGSYDSDTYGLLDIHNVKGVILHLW